MLAAKMMMAAGAAQQKIYADDVFSTYLYTGNGSTQTINNGIDLAGEGGLVWGKCRTSVVQHMLHDTARGIQNYLSSNSSTQSQSGGTDHIYGETSTGFSIGNGSLLNTTNERYVTWTFRKADKFFRPTTISHTNGTPTSIDFPSLETLGMVVAKITSTTGDWIVWHRSLTAGNNLLLNTTAAQSTTNAWLSVSGTTATLSASAPTGSYVVYGWAHDASTDGIVQCGSFTADGSSNATVTLGWEPQFVLWKAASISGNWFMADSMRGMTTPDTNATELLFSNLTNAASAGSGLVNVTSTGFRAGATAAGTYIYLAIRRPNKPPTSGTQVYNAVARTGTGAAATVAGVGFVPDLVLSQNRAVGVTHAVLDRVRGALRHMITETTAVEFVGTDTLTGFDVMDGVRVGADSNIGFINTVTRTIISHFFRRATAFLDVVCDTGTGSAHAVTHNLTVAPELLIRKSRSAATQWEVWHSSLAANEKLVLNSTAAKVTDATAWNSTAPTASAFTVGTGANVNTNSATYVTYLFATLAGISKVGSYTGNGGSQTINCGFTTGARFVLIKRTDSTGDWYVWDTARGIVAGNDPHLSLNTAAAEVTTDDSIDPNPLGFDIVQNSATNININGATYIYWSIA